MFLPAPVGGWNARDPISAMPPTDAVILDNLIPDAGYVRLRSGTTLHATIQAGGDVLSLFSWRGGAAVTSHVLFGATTAAIYDISAGGTIASASLTVASSGKFSHTMITTSAGSYLYVCDTAGGVTPRYFDGSAWTTSGFTGSGLTTSNLTFVAMHMNRLWFVEKYTNNAWYAPTSSISGTLTKFPIPFKQGGYLEMIVSWSRDGGSGPDDYIAFISSNGEIAVYAGTDPASSTTSALIGVFTTAKIFPVTGGTAQPNFAIKAGGDVAIMTRLGVAGLSQLLPTATSGTSQVSITDKIARAYQANSFTYAAIEEFPEEALVFINAKAGLDTDDSEVSVQFVLNTKTNVWCRFTGMDAFCLHRWEGSTLANIPSLFMGRSSGAIYRYHQTRSPDLVQARLVHAFNDFGTSARKRFLQARPRLHMTVAQAPPVSMCLDYTPTLPTSTTITDASSTTPSKWLEANWHTDLAAVNNWQGVSGVGFAGAPAMRFKIDSAATTGGGFLYHGCDVSFETGGIL